MRNGLFAILGAAGLLLVAAGTGVSHEKPGASNHPLKIDRSAFRSDMRRLWEDHITWTRLYIVSALADLPDKDATAGRLLRNQADIGNAIKGLYGNSAGDQLTALLRDHILFAADLITKVKSGDTAQSSRATAVWFANADSIARFLSTANPASWPYAEMKSMMHEHLKNTTDEVVARLHHDWQGDIAAYSKVHDQILAMADMLSEGIIHQFPASFK